MAIDLEKIQRIDINLYLILKHLYSKIEYLEERYKEDKRETNEEILRINGELEYLYQITAPTEDFINDKQ